MKTFQIIVGTVVIIALSPIAYYFIRITLGYYGLVDW